MNEQQVQDHSVIREEYEDSEPTGVELEQTDADDREEKEPWDPDLIRVDPKMFSLRHIMDMIDDQDLDLAPGFQRRLVWGNRERSRLIESLLLRIPLPAFYFDTADEGLMQVVDGLQRLSTIHRFVRKEGFALEQLEYLQGDVGGMRYADLASHWKRRINGTQIFVNVIDPQTPPPVKFNIFKRINTGGKPLNPQEIRHAMSGKTARAFLMELAEMQAFRDATAHVLDHHKRMADREIVLRFCAFRMFRTMEEYSRHETFDIFLTDANIKLDAAPEEMRDTLRDEFKRAMQNASNIFGEHAFRKWPKGNSGRKNPINRALFESWAVALADCEWRKLEPARERIVEQARTVMTDDEDYLRSVSSGTGDVSNVHKRFSTARAIIRSSVR